MSRDKEYQNDGGAIVENKTFGMLSLSKSRAKRVLFIEGSHIWLKTWNQTLQIL